MAKAKSLTGNQARLLQASAEYRRQHHGQPPTILELADQLGLYPDSIHEMIAALERHGYPRGLIYQKRRQGRKAGPLSATQKAIAVYIRQFIRKRGQAPSIREIGRHLRMTSPTGVSYHLRQLERHGIIHRERGVWRSIEMLEPNATID
jgi:SOS-response transcriptional repressor LexA